jgi:hypothetical protein
LYPDGYCRECGNNAEAGTDSFRLNWLIWLIFLAQGRHAMQVEHSSVCFWGLVIF